MGGGFLNYVAACQKARHYSLTWRVIKSTISAGCKINRWLRSELDSTDLNVSPNQRHWFIGVRRRIDAYRGPQTPSRGTAPSLTKAQPTETARAQRAAP
jgi:hypothetical protein